MTRHRAGLQRRPEISADDERFPPLERLRLGGMKGDSIGAVFPANRVDARFVMSMSMAKNDVERALRDVIRASENDDPDFSYRVRLVRRSAN